MMAVRVGLLLMVFVVPATGAERALPFSDGGWELTGERTAIAREGDRDVLSVETGIAYRRDVRLADGTIDFDVQVTQRRSFVYLMFRMAADGEHEEIYLRPHKSGLPDALQYAPVWQGRSAWQLHHGPGGTAAIEFEHGAWTHVRVVLRARDLALFVGDTMKPALVARMARDPRPGYIALRGFLPADTPGTGPIARFANVVVRPDEVAFDFGAVAVKARTPEPGTVRAWAVSKSFVAPKETATPTLPADLGEFQRLETEPDGLLELHRHVKVPAARGAAAAVARARVRAERAGTYAFDLGFSDIAIVFVNGRPIFRGEGSYSYDQPRREGLIGFDQARLYLPLEAGENDLAILVGDSFGGWGLQGRFSPADGLRIEAR
jgi:hypothetical protein